MNVIKRDGSKEPVQFDKITNRLEKLSEGLDLKYVKAVHVAKKVIEGLYHNVKTSDLDHLAAEIAASLTTTHPDYAKLASRIEVSNLHKNTSSSFSQTIKKLYEYVDPKTEEKSPLISKECFQIIEKNAPFLDSVIDYRRDFNFDYFGFKTLERSYLLKLDGKIVERPQQMLMRVSIGIHKEDLKGVIETYELLSEGWFIHATPTLFNAGTPKPQMSSCFLLQMKEDSIDGIYETLKQCAKISQSAGGIGLSIHQIRAKNSYIRGTNGSSNGLVPMLRVFNDTARYVDQGGGKRKGAFAVYLEPWHADIFDFLELRKNGGKEELRARDLFTALWIPDLFMKRVEADQEWSLFCPDEAKGLDKTYGKKFESLYLKYEQEGKARKTIRAQELWFKILESQIETGSPYMLYKDTCNQKSNQQNLGTIRGSNLCTEVLQFTSPEEVAVCNLASIALPKFVKAGKFDHKKLYEIVCIVTRNLNKVINGNYYPLPEARRSNLKNRPIGIGVQGLADAFILMGYSFESKSARRLNRDIFETIYFAAMTTSMELAKEEGPYQTYKGSPISKGFFQFDLWNQEASSRWDWESLRKEIEQYGVRNSLLVAPMPTASTSQILGNNECFEPYTSNIYSRRVLSGEFMVVNKHLLKDLIELGLWNEELKNQIIAADGSIQGIKEIPNKLKELYKTVWEIKQKTLIDLAADRGAFICQSQSLNLFLENPSISKLTSMHFYAWKKGLKTGMYYLRTKAATGAIKFTLQQNRIQQPKETKRIINVEGEVCSLENESCEACGS